jgi:ATP-dependent helicase/nuclease subunit A
VLSERGSLREVVEAAVEGSDYSTAVWLLPGGPRRAANFAKAIALAESMDGRFGFSEFLEVLADFRMREVRETEAPTGGEHEDVVRILTVHASKGLEFPVVFVPDLARKSGMPAPDLLHADREIAARLRDPGSHARTETSAWSRLAAARAKREEEESLRIFYVAVTRAEERLFLCGRGDRKAPAGSWQGALERVLDLSETKDPMLRIEPVEPAPSMGTRRVSLLSRYRDRIASGEPLSISRPGDAGAIEGLFDLAARPRPAPDGTPYQVTVSELLTYSACPRCHFERYRLGAVPDLVVPPTAEPDEANPDDRAGLDELPPSERGIAVHEVLKVWDPEGSEEEGVETARSRLASLLAAPSSALVSEAAGIAAAFFRSDLGRRVRSADPVRVRREVPFLVRWETSADRPDLLFRGQLDLLFPEPDGTLHILDYKTGRAPPERYHVQLIAYARAVRAFAPGAVRASLVYLRRGSEPEVHEVSLTDEAFRRVEEQADGFAAYLRTGGPIAESHSC